MQAYRRKHQVAQELHLDPLVAATIAQRGQELTMMMHLPVLEWPGDLYSAFPAAAKPVGADKCQCGCDKLHRQNVSKTTSHAGIHRVYWFYSGDCKRKWEKAHA
jgi:hypothetical protein